MSFEKIVNDRSIGWRNEEKNIIVDKVVRSIGRRSKNFFYYNN